MRCIEAVWIGEVERAIIGHGSSLGGDTAIGRGRLSEVDTRSSLRNDQAWLLQTTSPKLPIATMIVLCDVCGWHMACHPEPDHCAGGFFALHSHFASYKAHALNRSQQTDHSGTHSAMRLISATGLVLLVYYQVPAIFILWSSLVRHEDEAAWQLRRKDFSFY